MNLKRWTVIVALIAILGTVVGVSLEGTWAQTEPQIQASGSVDDGRLLARGVGISVPMRIACTGSTQITYWEMSAEIRQRFSKRETAFTSEFFNISEPGATLPVCNGEPQTVVDKTFVPHSAAMFRKGPALVRGWIFVCGVVEIAEDYSVNRCTSSTFTQEFRIR